MKKKIALVLLSTAVVSTALVGTLSVLAENAESNKTEYSFKKAPKGEIKTGKITSISDNTITVALAQMPEKQEKPTEPPTGEPNENEEPKQPELTLSGETVTVTVTNSVKIRNNASGESDISSLSVDTVVNLIYNENNELIEICTGGFGRHKMFDNKNCKIGKITSISDNTITVALAQMPEKQEKPTEPPTGDTSKNEEPKQPELTLSGETVNVTVTDSIKIKTNSSEDSDISSLAVDSVVKLIYNDNDELIEICTSIIHAN